MIDITETETFACNLAALSDAQARYRIQMQINRMRFGMHQHVTAVTEHIFALCVAEHQVYYAAHHHKHALLLCIGRTADADEDVACALKLAEEVSP